MTRKRRYKAEEVIAAIKGSGGIMTVIAGKLGCKWHTAQDYIRSFPTIGQAYKDEIESIADVAESIIIRNIQIAAKQQAPKDGPPQIVDTADARYYLSRKAKNRGYSNRVEVTGEDGEPIRVVIDE